MEQHKQHAAEIFQAWELKGHAKVALRVPTEQEMVRCHFAFAYSGMLDLKVHLQQYPDRTPLRMSHNSYQQCAACSPCSCP